MTTSTFLVRSMGGSAAAREERCRTESEALACAFAHIRDGAEEVSIVRPEGTRIAYDQILAEMAAD